MKQRCKKPADWVEEKAIVDAEAKKAEDWDDEMNGRRQPQQEQKIPKEQKQSRLAAGRADELLVKERSHRR